MLATSSCAKPVAVLASSCTLAVPVVAVFLITRPVEEAEAELVTLSTLVRHSVSSADLQHLVVGGVQDSGARGATLQGEVHLPKVGYQSRGSHLGGGSGHARHCQACTVTPLVPPLIVSRSSPILADTALVRMAAKQAPAMFGKPFTEAQLLERFQSCLKTSAQGVKFVKLKATLANVRFWDCEGKRAQGPQNPGCASCG